MPLMFYGLEFEEVAEPIGAGLELFAALLEGAGAGEDGEGGEARGGALVEVACADEATGDEGEADRGAVADEGDFVEELGEVGVFLGFLEDEGLEGVECRFRLCRVFMRRIVGQGCRSFVGRRDMGGSPPPPPILGEPSRRDDNDRR
jgi:hypothetical protein